jgi:hypothetical protein
MAGRRVGRCRRHRSRGREGYDQLRLSVARRGGDADDDERGRVQVHLQQEAGRDRDARLRALRAYAFVGCLRPARCLWGEGVAVGGDVQRARERLIHVHGLADPDRRWHGHGDASLHDRGPSPPPLLDQCRHQHDRPGGRGRAEREPELHQRRRPPSVAVDSGHVDWVNSVTNAISRADLDGQNPNQSFITGASLPVGVAVDAG